MTKIVATIPVIVLLVGTFLYAQSAAPPSVPVCVTDEDRVHIRAQVLAAVDDAFKDNVKHLFNVWLKDPQIQPDRASAGLQSSIVAYQRARADALRWTPASC
jgi:hypothetical protein